MNSENTVWTVTGAGSGEAALGVSLTREEDMLFWAEGRGVEDWLESEGVRCVILCVSVYDTSKEGGGSTGDGLGMYVEGALLGDAETSRTPEERSGVTGVVGDGS